MWTVGLLGSRSAVVVAEATEQESVVSVGLVSLVGVDRQRQVLFVSIGQVRQ